MVVQIFLGTTGSLFNHRQISLIVGGKATPTA